MYKEYEEAAVSFEACNWNKEASTEQRNKAMLKLQQLSTAKQDVES